MLALAGYGYRGSNIDRVSAFNCFVFSHPRSGSFVSRRSAKRYKYYGTRASTDLAMDAAQRCIEGRSSASIERSLLIEKIGLHDQGIEVFDECLRINRVPGGAVINAKGHDQFCALLYANLCIFFILKIGLVKYYLIDSLGWVSIDAMAALVGLGLFVYHMYQAVAKSRGGFRYG
ncbi:hypothetical protein EGJ52_23580 [Pseudomonas luteola]|uniref:hypothetical protein n=1 Tax=Pseudomonas TaxID=286 RepID=UPI0002CB5ABB|nr:MULTISPECIES: hypothetical protein [Pseudomonas]ENA27506.1 hypothetical protein HMPREF1487_09162 [Pseudomonas sp. HPB0071]RRW39801.1 hypothetical protein EGJ52_23580 [Pseudomonas luteola]